MPDIWDRKTDFCCSSCAFFVPKSNEFGRCRRHAPTMNGYPVVNAQHDWCGDHKIGTNPSKEKVSENDLEAKLKELR